MKNRLLFVAALFASLIGTSFAFTSQTTLYKDVENKPMEFTDDARGSLVTTDYADDDVTIPSSLTIHYATDDPVDYSTLRFYLWAGKLDGQEFEPVIDTEPISATDVKQIGMHITIDPREWGQHDTFMFIVKYVGTWNGQSTDTEIPYKDFPADENGELEVWAIPDEGTSLAVYATFEETQGAKITYAKWKDWKTIRLEGTHPILSYRAFAFTKEYYSITADEQNKQKERFLVAEGRPNTVKTDIVFNQMMPSSIVVKLEVEFDDETINKETGLAEPKITKKSKMVSSETLYKSARFEQYYTYKGSDLGVTYTPNKSSFKLWAPMCARVELNIYANGTPTHINPAIGSNLHDIYDMNYLAGGVWSAEVPGDLNGKYYTYTVYNSEGTNEVCDPYAKSAGINGIRGMILDFDTTDPEGWNQIPDIWDGKEGFDIKGYNELSVYEVHIRDLTMDESWGGTSKQGTYEAFREKGTRYTKDGVTVKTGFDHIEELGVNAIQILPFFDHSNFELDETPNDNKIDAPFNWGYNPSNYNVVEGLYSTDPYDGAKRVTELKEVVRDYALNANNTRVIMDVVYNHVFSVSSVNLTKIMPKYYFRINAEGGYHNGSGCGNEIKTEATMMRKLIVESVQFWATEYKIKGFRFDLMGLIDTETMRLVKDAVYAIDPDNVVYGEGWSLGYNGDGGTRGTTTYEVYTSLYPTAQNPGVLGGFNDSFRNAIRGSNDQGWGNPDQHPGWGLISQGASDVGNKAYTVAEGMKGIHPGNGANSYQTVNYASCHDNYTLYDQLYWTLSDDGGKTKPAFTNIAEAILAVQSAVAFSSGIAFFQSGEELFRTKIEYDPAGPDEIRYEEDMYGEWISHNSYKSSDATNAFKYGNKVNVEYDGVKIDTQKYFKKYCDIMKKRAEFTAKLIYPDNCNPNKVATWFVNDNENGSTGFGVYYNYKNAEYWLFFSGRVATTLSFDASSRSTCIFNTATNGNGYTLGNNNISLSPRQFVVFKA